MKPRILDLFCGAGGAGMGYARAGFEVVGVDVKPQPRYPFEFYQADAMTFPLDGFDAIHASPPCQLFTRAGSLREAQGGTSSKTDLLTPTLLRLRAVGVPWVVENVEGAAALMPLSMRLCGSSFGLRVRRHRLFLSRVRIVGRPCIHGAQGRPVGVYHRLADEVPHGGRTARTLAEAQAAMGIDWMTWDELKEAIPPAYTQWIGEQLMVELGRRLVAVDTGASE